MGEVVAYGNAAVVSITKADGSEYDSKDWRVNGIGRTGLLMVMEMKSSSPCEFFVRFSDSTGFCSFTTSCGELHRDDAYITLTTKNSIYTFEPIDEVWKDLDWSEEHVALYRTRKSDRIPGTTAPDK